MADNLQSQLQNKEKFLRTLVTLGIVAAGAYGIYIWGQIVPFLIDVAANTLHLAVLLAVLGLAAYAVLDGKTRTFASYAYAMTLRWLFSMFTDIDLIGTLKTVSSRMKGKLADVDQAIGTLRGQRDDLQKNIEQNEEEREQALKRAQAAQRVPQLKDRVGLEGRKAGRLKLNNEKLRKLLTQITNLHAAFVKRREAMDVKIQDIDDTIKQEARQRKSLVAGYKAMKAAQGVLGNSVDQEIWDDTLEKLATESAQMMGEIDTFMDMSKKINDGIDLDNMVYEEDAMAELDSWSRDKSNVRVDPHVVQQAQQGTQDFDALFEASEDENNKQTGHKGS